MRPVNVYQIQMNRRHLYLLASALLATGLLIFFYKAFILNFPLKPNAQVENWDIEMRMSFKAQDKPVKLSLLLPPRQGTYNIVDERFISKGYGLNTGKKINNRQVVWSVRKAKGEQFLYYRATVSPSNFTEQAVKVKPSKKSQYLEPFTDSAQLAAESLLKDVSDHSADTESLVSELLKRLKSSSSKDDNVRVLLGNKANDQTRILTTIRLLALVGIQARIVNGVRLETLTRSAAIQQWLEVAQEGYWQAYSVDTASPGIPENYMTWWRGPEKLVYLTGGKALEKKIAISLRKESALLNPTGYEKQMKSAIYEYSLLALPIETQAVYQILLTVPLGVFFLVILRNIIGLKTFGTFMPVLIAMAFRETQLFWGIALFITIVGLGLGIRFYLEYLKLLLVPRLASVLIIVIILMAFISLVSYKLGIMHGLSIALFPMVILTMTIERMSIVWEEHGALEAIQQGIGSLFAASLTYLLMSLDSLQHIVFVFPETLLILLAATLLLGRYTGYRLFELFRFKALAKGK